MELLIENCPKTGLKRKVKFSQFNWNKEQKNINIVVYIHYLNENNVELDDTIKPIRVVLNANNRYIINKETYETKKIDQNQEIDSNWMNEYDFWEEKSNEQISLNDAIMNQIIFANNNNKF